ncbi:beta strand repeat-containing protein, partial [Mariniradius sediminis]|nr:hypothetical protein [Mariniradius sediminis]
SYDAVGDVLNYTVTVTNTGNVTLSNVVVVDPLTGLNQTIASLAPTASQSFNTSYAVTQADIDAGSVANTASASSGSVSVSDQVTVNAVQSPALGIQKTVAEGSFDAVGDVLNYTIVVTNTGNVTMSNVVVVDPLTGLNQTIASLAPTASQSFNTSYTIVQSDLDNGSVANTASASSGSVSVSDQVTVNAVQSPALSIDKSVAENSFDAVGDVLNYTIVVTNTGNTTLSNVVVVDPLTGLNQTISSLAPTASQSFNTSYTIVQSDLDNGSVANTASATSGPVSVSDQATVNAVQSPALSIDKSVAESSFDAVGDVLNYTIVVTNTGNTTLSNVVVVDPLTGLNQNIASLAPTASQSFNTSYTIVQSDLDNGSVGNTASASSGSVSVSDQVTVNAVQSPALSIDKSVAESSFDAVGDVLNYTIVVTNTGNVTLSNVVVVDPLTGLNQTIASLAPTASQNFNTSYTIVQSDLDNGSVSNTASASSGSVSVSDQVTVNAVQSPALSIDKSVAENSFDAVGDVLNYTIVVTNTGNVTLSNVVVVDPLTGLNQTIASLAPTASQSFNTSYTIVQSDLDNGSVANTASASSGSVSVSDQVTVNAVQSPALSIQKTVAEGSYDAVGDVLNYTIVVTNTGNVTLSNVVVVDPLTGLSQTIASLAPTASQSFNTSYTIVQSDLDNGSVANTASATSGPVSVSDQVVVNAVQSPALSIQKTATEGSFDAVGDVLNFTIVVTNTGNTTLSNVVVVDPLTGLNQTISSLAPTASQSFNTSYAVTQSDIDAGSVANTASASSGSVSVSDQVVVNAVQSPALSIDKTVAESSYDAVSDVLNYTVTVTNTGNVTLLNVVVVDPLTGLNQTIASLAPTASQSFNTSYTIVQSDLDNGSVGNTASASSGSVSVSDQVTVNAVQSPALSIDKSVAESSFDAVGDVLNYTIVVTNTGNVTLTNIVLVDPLTGLNQTIASLAPTASQSFNTSYSIVQSDLDNGSVANTASASSGSVSVSDQVTVNAVQSPALSIQKTVAEGSYDAVGDVLNYTIVVTNTGNVTLPNVVVVDPLTGLNQTIASLAPTASQSFNTSYSIVQSDLDNGSVANTASASSGSVSVSDQVTVNAVQSPALSIQKTVAESSFDAVGDVLNYTIVVTNTGNVTLPNVVVVDPLTGLNQTIASLAPTASQSFNTSYAVNQADIDAGSVANTASASSGSVNVSDQVVVSAVQSPALSIDKSVAETSFDAVGDVLNYTIVVTNTGNVTLSNVVVVDPLTGLNQTIASLAATASQSFNTSYTIVQSDLDNGSVGNTASATSGSVSVSDQVTVNAVQSPALSIQKTVAEGSFDAVGDVLNYTIVVTNTGNTTLSNVVVIDPLTGLNQTIASLAPTASQSFNTSYTIVQSDLDNGSVGNTASASSGSVSVSDQVTVNAVQSPALSIQKTVAEGSFDAVGDVLNYTVTVTNTGNTTLSNVVVVDPLTGLNQTIASLAPTASQSFNTSYSIVQSDLDNGSVANTASATSGPVSVSDQVVVNAVQSPALSIQKTATEGSFDAVGDVLNFTIVVTNTGNTTLSNVVVVDPLTGLNQTIASLAPTASQSFNTSYTVVQSDLDNGAVGNTASASSGSVSVSDQATVNAVQSPALSIQKTVAEGSFDAVGDVLNYTIVVTNTGNVTL